MKKAIALIMAMMMVSSFAACNKTEEKPAETTPAAPVETPAETTPAAPAETPAETAPVEAAKPEAIDLTAKMEEIKGLSASVTEITVSEAAEGIVIDVKMSAEDGMADVDAALVEVLDADDVVAANLFQNTEEAKVVKTYTINYYVGGEEVTHKSTAGYNSSNGRKGILYVQNDAWKNMKAVEANA